MSDFMNITTNICDDIFKSFHFVYFRINLFPGLEMRFYGNTL